MSVFIEINIEKIIVIMKFKKKKRNMLKRVTVNVDPVLLRIFLGVRRTTH